METEQLFLFHDPAGGVFTAWVTYEVAEPRRIRNFRVENTTGRPGYASVRRNGEDWEGATIPPGTEVDRVVPGNRRVPIDELTVHGSWPA